jgi:hypothetical protein
VPERIQLRRIAGWRKPAGAIVVARPSRFGNPFQIEKLPTSLFPAGSWGIRDINGRVDIPWELRVFDNRRLAAVVAVRMFELHTGPMGAYEYDHDEVRAALAGRDLGCWCPILDADGERFPCHGDPLLARVNDPAVTP